MYVHTRVYEQHLISKLGDRRIFGEARAVADIQFAHYVLGMWKVSAIGVFAHQVWQ